MMTGRRATVRCSWWVTPPATSREAGVGVLIAQVAVAARAGSAGPPRWTTAPRRCRAGASSRGPRVRVRSGAARPGPAAPHAPVGDLPGEGVMGPVRRFGRYDVEVTVRQRRFTGAAASPRDHLGASALGLEQLRLDADLVQQRRDVLGRGSLPGPVLVAVVGGVDADQVAADVEAGSYAAALTTAPRAPREAPTAAARRRTGARAGRRNGRVPRRARPGRRGRTAFRARRSWPGR